MACEKHQFKVAEAPITLWGAKLVLKFKCANCPRECYVARRRYRKGLLYPTPLR